MPGLSVWREDGTLSFDGSASLLRMIGSFTSNTAVGSMDIPALAAGRPWVFAHAVDARSTGWGMPVFWASGTTVTWSSPVGIVLSPTMIVYYGVY